MKAIILILALVTSTMAFSESYKCGDKDGVWKISFNYENEVASDIKFMKNGELVESYKEQAVSVSRMRLPFSSSGVMVYEIALGNASYLDFERRYRGSEIETTFQGAFLLSSHPFRFEKNVFCSLSLN